MACRWRTQRRAGTQRNGLTPAEDDEIVAVFNDWAHIDRSHRKLAHRGSWLNRFWADPSTVRRVLERRALRFRAPKREGRSQKRPWPDWVEETLNRIWTYDTTHWTAADAATTFAEDKVRRRLREIARKHPRWGWKTAHTILRREGHTINHKHTRRGTTLSDVV
jgi:hypothetical protein